MINITPVAAEFIKRQMCFPPKEPTILFRELELSKEKAEFLGGPFVLNGRYYGLVSVSYEKKLPNEAEMLQAVRIAGVRDYRMMALPATVSQAVKAAFGDSSRAYYYEGRNKKYKHLSFSDFDLLHGADEISNHIRSNLKASDSPCSFFCNTDGAFQIIENLMNAEQKAQWQSSLSRLIESSVESHRRTAPCAERPYRVYLQGDDDYSWTTTRSSMESVKVLLADIKKFGKDAVKAHMTFTN